MAERWPPTVQYEGTLDLHITIPEMMIPFTDIAQ